MTTRSPSSRPLIPLSPLCECRAAAALILACAATGCALVSGPIATPNGPLFERSITLNGHAVRLHMANAGAVDRAALLVYATGDRGWAGKDLDTFRHLSAWGYPVVGFDAHDYVKHLGGSATTTPGRLARDFEQIIATARGAMHVAPAAPTVLVGVSRGAGLSVVAAGQRPLRTELTGVVAIGLTKEEEYVRWIRRLEPRPRPGPQPEMVEVYEYLPRLASLPITVIQSTHDGYLPAAAARTLFGPDTDRHRLIAVESRNHSFSDARPEMYAALKSSLEALAPHPIP